LQNPKDHVELATAHGLISWEDAIRISGSGFAVYRGKGAKLERALINFLLDTQAANGYEEVNVPHLVLRECMEGTGQLPKFESDMYGTEPSETDHRNTLFLAPTAEVPVTNLYRDTIVAESDLPMKLVAYTPCFRREAGSAGRDNKGIIRMHQFDKVELVQVVEARTALPRHRTLHRRHRSVICENLRHRGMGSRPRQVFGSLQLLVLRRLPGASHETSL
jgi:seryl-tRNA synthetase